MKTDFSRFIVSALIMVVALVLVDVLVGFVGNKSLDYLPDFNGKVSGQTVKNNYRIMKMEDDIVIVGSSRVSHHYNATMLADSICNYTGMRFRVYNAGIDGQFINSSCMVVESMLSRYIPKMLVLEAEDSGLKYEKGKEMKSSYLYFNAPYYDKTHVAKRYFDEMGWKERIMVKSKMFRYNDKVLRIGESFLKKGTVPNDGFEPLFGTSIDTTLKKNDEPNKEMVTDEYSERNLRRVLQLCKDKGVNLVLVSSPRFRSKNDNTLIRSLSQEYDVPYIEIYNTKLFNSHPEFFKDASHLNNEGATIYTQMFFEELKPYLEMLR